MDDPLLTRLRLESERDRLADCNLFIGPSRRRLRELARACGGVILGARGALDEHPDAIVFDPDALGVRGLQVAHVAEREGGGESVEAALRYKPLQGGRRVVLIYEVDRMTADAQAALLKTAEEPPAGTHFLLTAADPTPVLPALLSRSRIARVAAPDDAELDRKAAAAGIEAEDFRTLTRGLGRAEAALDLDAEARADLLETAGRFRAWLADPAQAPAWLEPPDGSLAEQRETAGRRLAACLGWLAEAYPAASAEQALRLDRLADRLAGALGDLGGQVGPSLILEELAARMRDPESWPRPASGNTIS